MSPQRILVVDDEESLLTIISYALESAGFDVATATDAEKAIELVEKFEPNLLILDVMLPGQSGLDVCREVRNKTDIPIIIVSAKSEEVDKILGLELGADDYVTKPFSPRELVSRVRAQLRRQEGSLVRVPNVIETRGLKIDCESHQVFLRGEPLHLTNSEFQILQLLARNPGKAFSRSAILNYLWDGGFVGDERTVDVHIHNLRDKFEDDPQKPTYLLTVRGIGYRLSEK